MAMPRNPDAGYSGVGVDELVDDRHAFTVGVVDLHERLPLVRQGVLREDRLDRALGLAGPAVDALIRVDVEHIDALEVRLTRRWMDTIDGTDVHA